MDIDIFKKNYVIRRFGGQQFIDGYATAPYTDGTIKLNVQPLNSDEMQALPEGERTIKRLKSFGKLKLTAADQYTGVPGDRLFYYGRWYECVSSVNWDHTPISHFRSEFVAISEKSVNTAPPEVVL